MKMRSLMLPPKGRWRSLRRCASFALFCGLLATPLLASSGKLLSLRILPQELTLWGAGASQRFVLLGLYADGIERDLTSEARFTVSDDGIAVFAGPSRLVGLSDGTLTLPRRP